MKLSAATIFCVPWCHLRSELRTPPRNKWPFRLLFFKRRNILCGYNAIVGVRYSIRLLLSLASKETSPLVSPAGGVGVGSSVRFDFGGIGLGTKTMRDALLMAMDPGPEVGASSARNKHNHTAHDQDINMNDMIRFKRTTRIPRLDGVHDTCCA